MERNFKGIWIPKEIWLSKELTLQEKVFLVEIDSLDNEEGCFAGNAYFADFFGISKTRVSLVIKSLIEKRYITSTIIYKEGTKQILKRVLKVCYRPYLTNVKDPIKEKLKENNTSSNTVNNTKNNIYTDVYNYYLSKDNLIKHKKLTGDMKKAIDKAKKELGLDLDYFKRIIDRHSDKVEATKNNGQYKIKTRTLSELFGQKKRESVSLICSDYLDEVYTEYKKNTKKKETKKIEATYDAL